jgi:hypothetical protein
VVGDGRLFNRAISKLPDAREPDWWGPVFATLFSAALKTLPRLHRNRVLIPSRRAGMAENRPRGAALMIVHAFESVKAIETVGRLLR